MAPRRPCGLTCACLAALLVAAAGATQFRVGGQRGWSVPGAGTEPYNAWAGRLRFQIGDQLLFVYPKETDAVLLVEQSAYDACNTTAYAARFADGATVFTLGRSGPFFFVSGNESSCRSGKKLIVVVLADRSGSAPPPSISVPPTGAPPMPSPSTSPPSAAPVPAPAEATPSSAPSPSPSPAALALSPGPATLTPTSSPPSPVALAPSPSSSPATPGGAGQPPSASGGTPGAEGGNSTTPASPSASDRGGAAPVVAALATSLGACVGYACSPSEALQVLCR